VKNNYRLLSKYAIHIAFSIAWLSTLGSLYFSQILKLVPCELCWFQRILMYPLVILFTVALVRKDKNVAYYALPMSTIGAGIATYQYLLQMTPLKETTPFQCNLSTPCSEIQFSLLGFITIPFLSFAAFATISILMIILIKSKVK